MRLIFLLSGLALLEGVVATDTAQKLIGIPTLYYQSVGNGSFDATKATDIVVDQNFAQKTDKDGSTLIPPTLLEFATTFASDLTGAIGRNVSVVTASKGSSNAIYLTLGSSRSFRDAAGNPTSEGYQLDITEDGMKVTGASPLGVWWGTRSILQQFALKRSKFLTGSILDAPGWATRGILLDAGRHYYPPEFLIEMCAYMSFFKQNTFHVHLSDDVLNLSPLTSNSELFDRYAAFRLASDDPELLGLARRTNESYTRNQFESIQHHCAARGVTVIPEIEAPAHSLSIVQWKPQLGLSDDLTKLNISHPETISTVELIWKKLLPWFHSKVVHIGADEYSSTLLNRSQVVSEYTRFVNKISATIARISDKTVRIWGTFPPTQNAVVNKSVSIQHWSFTEDNPISDFIANGYKVLNSDEMFYSVGKIQAKFGTKINLTRVFHGSPDNSAWAPNIFDAKNSSNNTARNDSAVLGHIAALWNDFGPNATIYSEAYYAFRDGLPALADKQWGGSLLEGEYITVFNTLQAAVPGQNLDRRIASRTSEIFNYNFTSPASSYSNNPMRRIIKDTSQNGYNATTDCYIGNTIVLAQGCTVKTPLQSKGRNYTLSFAVKLTSPAYTPFLTGADSQLLLHNNASGCVTLISAGNEYSANYSFPVGNWIEASLVGASEQTFLKLADGSTHEFLAEVGLYGKIKRMAPVAIEAPLAQIGGGGFRGEVKILRLIDSV